MRISFHCHSTTSQNSLGQAQTTQLGFLLSGQSPGQPEKQLIWWMPSFSAMSTALCMSSSNCLAISLLGWTGLPWQLRALISRPDSSMVLTNSLNFASSWSSTPGSQWSLPGYPPQPISTIWAPRDLK